MFYVTLFAVLLCPLIISYLRRQKLSVASYAFNNGETGFFQSLGSVICGNIGVGTFVGIYLFTRASPVIGLSIVVAYTLGLILCGFLAKSIYELSRKTGTYSLIDLINVRHGGGNAFPIWLPVAFIFILRSSVQMSALGLIISEAFSITWAEALLASTALTACYTLIGGYKAATETDLFQSVVIVLLMGVAMFGVGEFIIEERPFFDLGPYKPFLLIGVFVFLPLSPVLAVDNWQRMATAANSSVARYAYFAAAFICCAVYLSIFWIGMLPSPSGDVLQTFRLIMPLPWLADVLFITCIMSSIDTFVMPLISTLARAKKSLSQLRLGVLTIFIVLGFVSYWTGDLLKSIITAFNSLTVFLPAILGSFLIRKPLRKAAFLSLNGGVVGTLMLSFIDLNIAAIGGFFLSAALYLIVTYFGRVQSSKFGFYRP